MPEIIWAEKDFYSIEVEVVNNASNLTMICDRIKEDCRKNK